MGDYIDRENYCKTICRCDRDYCDKGKCPILTAPSAGVRPVVRGRWEFVKGSNGKEYMVCSECRVQQDLSALFTYCPNCGAIMVWED